MAVSKEEILDTIAGMTVMEVVELIEAMEEKFGVTAAAAVAAAPAVSPRAPSDRCDPRKPRGARPHPRRACPAASDPRDGRRNLRDAAAAVKRQRGALSGFFADPRGAKFAFPRRRSSFLNRHPSKPAFAHLDERRAGRDPLCRVAGALTIERNRPLLDETPRLTLAGRQSGLDEDLEELRACRIPRRERHFGDLVG